ncbi:DBF4-type zinc finger-containing protein 2 isoform X1 [Pleuronectes platessa]|uniref:DBF4-type zinc finger-containing protein 2 isoform X1 n=2 Tax=Pleuronectes platessa TaxID=8262 RepID=UPI00232A3453|nr:DBF4-type zinc finger-containing protein 2 isoform X1 [Pleuronectes platessa]XP_053273253.1 DBF4-type zinc finger-containing protein 2 isoform X1 [Pleuronectes platessa]XP_053273254.1 DBF4-type zinc finger-containing protein 2 isoform X1 [Pleuronectes platessa]XP_053273255.1 DBF4-type zinc finger-containing protein 2 isoform X1 [Pleuronectes platessa]
MSHSSDGGGQKRAESSSRMWAESEPGPSRCQPSRQGYCGYCRVLYSSLEQHLSSLRHLDSVRTSSRCSAPSATTSCSKLTLLERFLQDVLQHHPHRYSDPRPSHADLPSISAPPLPRAELDELDTTLSDNDIWSLGNREQLPSSDDTSYQPTNQQDANSIHSQSEDRGAIQDRLYAPITDGEEKGAASTGHTHTQAPPPRPQASPSIHRKAHRKTNRRKTSVDSSTPSRGPGPLPHTHLSQEPGAAPGPRPPTDLGPWRNWQRDRREGFKDQAFSDHSNTLDQTIEEVIQMCGHGITSTSDQQEETESFHFSLPVFMETQSDDWDSPVQVSPAEGRDLGQLMDVQVRLDDQVYSHQLDSALHSKAGGGATQEQGFWALPIEQILPAPAFIPESFWGKTWAQIEQEDEEKVERLVGQFRRGRFVCYFDSESLARYGRRSQNIKGSGQNKAAELDSGVLPLLDADDDDSTYGQKGRRRGFRLASRCQVVKVSHGTQTVRLVIPAVRQPPPETPPTSFPAADQDAAERTPEGQMWRCLPASYSNIITPVQPRTSLVYLLCSPSGPAPTCPASPGSAPKRCRKKRRPLDLQGVKVKYKRLPFRFYDSTTNRILKNPPKGSPWCQGPAASAPPPPCVRQLFRSLSTDLNTDRALVEGSAGSSRVKGHTSAEPPFLLSTLGGDTVRRRSQTSKTPPPRPHNRSEQGRGGRKERTIPAPSKRRTRAQATPPPTRRQGLRRTGLSPASLTHCSPARRGRGRRGRR